MKLPLSGMEVDELSELAQSDVYKLLLRELDRLARSQEQDVLNLPMTTPEDERKLVYKKCAANGARKLINDLDSYIKKIKKVALTPQD